MAVVRTRFAPSPTGYLHIGSLRTALYAYAFAKSQSGEFVLRIEDTDRSRFVPGATESLIKYLKMFGIDWDEGPIVDGPFAPYVQSERVRAGVYRKYAEKLLSSGHAYCCFCQPKTREEIKGAHEEKRIELRDPCRTLTKQEVELKIKEGVMPAIRLKVPDNEKISYYDFILKKEIVWETRNIDEVMLLKSDGFPTYHLAVVVDDSLMKITHITRAHEWLPSTPVHLLLFKFLGFDTPQIGHFTAILDPSGGKLSKRKGSVAVEDFLKEGYLPEAILNFVMLLGWAPKDNRELFTLKEFVDNFQAGQLQTSNPVFNRKKLDWFNGVYIRQKSDEELISLLQPFLPQKADEDTLRKVIPLIKERIIKLSDFIPFAGFFFIRPKVELELFGDLPYKEYLSGAVEVLKKTEVWADKEIQKALGSLIEKNGWKVGDFYMSMRIALTGSRFTPPITGSAEILGKEETIRRLEVFLR